MISKHIINERDKAIAEAIENNNLSLIKDLRLLMLARIMAIERLPMKKLWLSLRR